VQHREASDRYGNRDGQSPRPCRVALPRVVRALREIAVIAPFEAQVTAHYSALRRICGSDMPRVGTIHAIQGDASEVVVLDLTDAAGLELSHYFRSCHQYEDEGARLLTVALSRARCHVVLVADYRFMLKVSSPGPIAHRIVHQFWRSARPRDR
jgi:hypothetical protein